MAAWIKICTRCYALHDIDYFNRDRTTQDGLYPQCKDCSRAACKKVFRKYNLKHRALKQRWKDENRDRHHEINRQYRKDNPEVVREGSRRYRERLARATPPWADLELIRLIRSECPDGYHVDHVHPLKGENFCGLNVPWNLQYLPAEEHWRKGTKLPVAQEATYNL